MKKLNIFLVLSAVLASAMSNASAATEGPITTSTPILSTLTDFTGTLAFPQFNPSLGTLDSVTLDFSTTLNTIIEVQNTGISPSFGTVKTMLAVTVEDGGLNLGPDPVINALSPSASYSLGSGQTFTSGSLSKTMSGGGTYSAPVVLSEFTGGGNILLDASTLTMTMLANHGDGNTSASQTTDADLTGTVEYTYTPSQRVPDATSTAGLLTLACGVVSFFRRQRK